MKVLKKILVIFLILVSFIYIISPKISAATEDINTNTYKTTINYKEGEKLFEKGNKIIKLLRNIAAVVAVVAISILGLNYILGSVEEKAQYKEKMLPIVIGAVLIVSISSILITISNMMN